MSADDSVNWRDYWFCAAVAATVLWWMAPDRMTDADTLSRLAIGRTIVATGSVPHSDPFTFADASGRANNTEWLGDALLYATYRAWGEVGLQVFARCLVTAGWLLALYLGARGGAGPWLILGLLLCMVPASVARFAARNDIHALWLAPLYVLVCERLPASRPARIAAWGCALVWANLHASFLLGWIILLATCWEQRRAGQRLPWSALALAFAYPLLPLLGPAGASAYRQLLDHALGAGVYRAFISEWQSPILSSGVLAIGPLHVLAPLGALALALDPQRGRVASLATFVLGTSLAYTSRRFLPLMGVLALPAMAAPLWRLSQRLPARARRGLWVGAGGLGAAYLALGLGAAVRRVDVPVLERRNGPQLAARFVAAHSPAGSRLFNTFDDGPFLMWLTAPRIPHDIDPRNHLGAQFLARYAGDLLPNPLRFEREVSALRISLALLPTLDGKAARLARYLETSAGWQLVYWDGHHVLYARRLPLNEPLTARFGYRVLRARFNLEYLRGSARRPELGSEVERLRAQSLPLAQAIEGYLRLRAEGAGPEAAARAADLLSEAVPALPPSSHLMLYWALALERAGRASESQRVLQAAQTLFPELAL